MTLAPAMRALSILATVDARDRAELPDALCTVEQSHARWEREHGNCALCGPGSCVGVRVIGMHCPECGAIVNESWCELDTLRNGKEIVRVTCPCGEIAVIERTSARSVRTAASR
jgi:hypothetical protein